MMTEKCFIVCYYLSLVIISCSQKRDTFLQVPHDLLEEVADGLGAHLRAASLDVGRSLYLDKVRPSLLELADPPDTWSPILPLGDNLLHSHVVLYKVLEHPPCHRVVKFSA